MRRALALTLAVAACAAIVCSSCRQPTEIVVDVYTDAPWSAGSSVAFVASPAADESERRASAGTFTTVAADPWGADGFVGSLGVVPAGQSTLSIVVVAGIGRPAADCRSAPASCIVSR